ncbi:hypothetical protein M0R36_11300, partial [bacterium]|nr:hypothetical protein [bacterium]
MKITKPIETRGGVELSAALIRLRRIEIDYTVPFAQVTIDVFKDVAAEAANDPIPDPATGDRFHVTMDDGPEAQAFLAALEGKTVMAAASAWLKSAVGSAGVVNIDAT